MMKNGLIVALMLTAASCDSKPSGFAGTYTATFSGNYANTTPNTASGTYTDTATITVTDRSNGRVELRWQGASNPQNDVIVFALTGSTGTAVRAADAAGNCFTGTIANGNVQTSCWEQGSITFSGRTFTQQQSGTYSGTTPLNDSYTGNYSGTWTGTNTN
jgi:hypothetical protein